VKGIQPSPPNQKGFSSKVRSNAEQWKRGERVTQKRGLFKSVRNNPCGISISKREPLKQRGCLLVDRASLTAKLGKRRSAVQGETDWGFREESHVKYCLAISRGKLCLQECRNPAQAYMKNLRFLQGGRRSCKQLKFIAHLITDIGITLRLYRKLSYAATLLYAGAPAKAHKVYKSVATQVGSRRPYKGPRMQFGRASALRPRHLFSVHDEELSHGDESLQGFSSDESSDY
jgi:hypothetical protein